MKKSILHIIYIFLTLVLACQTENASATDTQHLLNSCEEARMHASYESLAPMASKLLSESKRSGDTRAEAYALFYSGLADLFIGSKNKPERMLNQSLSLALKIGNDSIAALATNALGIYYAVSANNSFIAQQFFFRSLQYADRAGYEQLRNRIYGNMIILSNTATNTSGLQNAHRIYEYGMKYGDEEQLFMGAYYLAIYYNTKGRNDLAEQYIKKALEVYKRFPYDDVASVYTLYAKVKVSQHKYAEAAALALKAIAFAEEHPQAGVLPDAYLQYAAVLHEQGKYAESSKMAHKALEATESYAANNKAVACYELIAANALRLGDKDEALKYLQKSNDMMDTLTTVNMDRLMHERQIMLQMDEQEKKAEEHRQQMVVHRNLAWLFFFIVLLLVALLIQMALGNRKRNKLYKGIVASNTRHIQQEELLQERLKEQQAIVDAYMRAQEEGKDAAAETKKTNQLTDDGARVQQLFDRVSRLMETERVYTEPQLTRERLAEMLGTNRTYLSQVIKEKSGMNYQQFINSYRINEAIRILSDRSKADYPLKQLWSDLGFNSASTFYKLFQQSVGITPSVYRKQFMNFDP